MGRISLLSDDVRGAADTPGPIDDCESTPLLVHHDNNLEANYPAAFRHQRLLYKQETYFSPIRQFWNWLLKHFMTLILSCLFYGGIFAIVIYIGGALHGAFLSQICLSTHSQQLQKVCAFVCCNLSHSSLCACCSRAIAGHVS